MRSLHRLKPADADRLRSQEVTYSEVGATVAGDLPAGYRELRHIAVLGHGAQAYADAAAGLFAWTLPLRSGLTVFASADTVELGAVARMVLGIGRIGLPAPVRVVAVVDEPGRRGFAYGTLPGHPECGEELFQVVLRPDGVVVLEITAFSRPATWLARLAGPVTHAVQALITRRYGRALCTG